MRRSPVLLAATALLIAATAAAELPDKPARDHDITVDDYFTIATILEVAVSPDGRAAAFIENRWEPPAEKRNADLWTVDLATRELQRLSFDAATESSPTWSPDGRFIYYTASYSRPGSETPPWDGSTQVWRIAAAGGEPQAVTRVVDGVDHFRLSHDGHSLIYAVGSEQTDDEWKELREQFDELEYGHGVTTYTELWTVDLRELARDQARRRYPRDHVGRRRRRRAHRHDHHPRRGADPQRGLVAGRRLGSGDQGDHRRHCRRLAGRPPLALRLGQRDHLVRRRRAARLLGVLRRLPHPALRRGARRRRLPRARAPAARRGRGHRRLPRLAARLPRPVLRRRPPWPRPGVRRHRRVRPWRCRHDRGHSRATSLSTASTSTRPAARRSSSPAPSPICRTSTVSPTAARSSA